MEIVPRADSLVVQAKVAPHDIDQVAIGASAQVRIMAGNQRTTPNLNGTVFDVSPDLTRDAPQAGQPANQQSQPYYQVRIRLPESEIERLGDLRLIPGMPTETFIRTQDRTALQYLLH